ncbi:MAG: hypothetical protein RL177_492 [Bacteroidota bacterium]|jgi:hypothetical protein
MINLPQHLEEIDLHDTIFSSITLDIKNISCRIITRLWDEDISDYASLVIDFLNLTLFNIVQGVDGLYNHDDILEFNIKEETDHFEYEFILYSNKYGTIRTIQIHSQKATFKFED